MITVTRLNGEQLVVNGGLIEFIERIPETMITLTTGRKLSVRETMDEVVQRVKQYEQEYCPSCRTVKRQGVVLSNMPREDDE